MSTTTTITPEQKKAATAEKRAATLAAKKLTAALDAGTGERVTVQLVDGDPVTGKLSQAADKDDERRFKVGARVVTRSRIAGIEIHGDQPTSAESAPAAVKAEPVGFTGDLPAAVRDYANTKGSDDPAAPADGKPFVSKDRLYLQVAGRAEDGGLLGYLQTLQADVSKGALLKQVTELGFARKPFSFAHPEKGQTSASYYSAPVGNLPAVALQARKSRERVGGGAQTVASVRRVIDTATIPVRPTGTAEQQAECQRLEDEYNAARTAWRTVANGKAGQDAHDEAKAATREAQQEWLAYRRMMVGAPAPADADAELDTEPSDAPVDVTPEPVAA